MPELPEVEIVVRALNKARICDKTITDIDVYFGPKKKLKSLVGDSFQDISRRGKYIIFQLKSSYLFVHLRMSGKFLLKDEDVMKEKHEHVIFHFEDGRTLRFFDPRKFGTMQVVKNKEEIIDDLGPEPLKWKCDSFCKALAERRGMIKPLLLNQSFIAGIGNVYADEALWQAHIHPQRHADSLSEKEMVKLHKAIQKVLKRGIEFQGTSLGMGLSNFQGLSGEGGNHQNLLDVYGRQGLPCKRCKAKIKKIIVGQRGTHFCPKCQVI